MSHALENELLSLALGHAGRGTVASLANRLRERHPDVTPEAAADIAALCLRAKDDAFEIVAAVMSEGGSQVQASGRILAAHPWLSTRNLQELCAQGFVLMR